mmetsp:Transcript_8056/g.29908  ORF Transcript_8056/g.29908 Transcript_8056/m.29908 type:complete len:343 (+) Transcript_8056:5788-6816(+)
MRLKICIVSQHSECNRHAKPNENLSHWNCPRMLILVCGKRIIHTPLNTDRATHSTIQRNLASRPHTRDNGAAMSAQEKEPWRRTLSNTQEVGKMESVMDTECIGRKHQRRNKPKKAGGMLSDPSKKKKHVTNSSMKKASNYTRIYAGFWRDGKKHGEGIYYYKNGDIYDGEWREDKRSGEGTLFVANGTKYEGEWYNDAQEGFGILYELNGNRYEGQFQEGKKHGSGVYYYVDKCRRYKGEWIEDVAKCGEISDYNKDVDESDAEIERMTGEVILLPKVQLRDHQSVLEEMKIHLRNAYAEKQQGRTNADGPFAAEEIYSDEEGGGESFENQLIKNMRDMDF